MYPSTSQDALNRVVSSPTDCGVLLRRSVLFLSLVSHVKVENVFGVGPLDADGKGLEGMKGEGYQSPRGHGDHGCLGEPGVDFELE